MASPRSAREIRSDDTRRRLFVAAAELFGVHGYHGTTVDDIVKRAGVAKGTFFLHFATKDAVVAELAQRQVRVATRARDATRDAGGTPLEALRAVVLALGEQAGGSRGLSRAMLAATLENPRIGGDVIFGEIHASLIDDVKAAQQAGLLGAGLDPRIVASALMACYLGAGVMFMSSTKAKPLLELLAPLVDACLQGFRAAPAPAPASAKSKR